MSKPPTGGGLGLGGPPGSALHSQSPASSLGLPTPGSNPVAAARPRCWGVSRPAGPSGPPRRSRPGPGSSSVTDSANVTGGSGQDNRGLFTTGRTGYSSRSTSCQRLENNAEACAGGGGRQEFGSCRDPARLWLVIHVEGHTAQNASGNKHAFINTGTS